MTGKPPFLPYGRQTIDDDDVAAVARVLRSDWLTTGPAVEAFERAVAQRVGAPFAVACSSGTAALHLAALALGLGEGDTVVVPSVTFLATANAARYVGAEVVFADVDPATGLMRAQDLEDALARADKDGTGRVRAVFPVHLTGQTADMPAIAAVAAERGLALVEDACHALGATDSRDNRAVPVGACDHAAMAAFSFHPVKTIACGEGGMVTTRDAAMAERLARFRNHGIVRGPDGMHNQALAVDGEGTANPWYHEMPDMGFNYRASDIHCALGLSQIGKLDRFLARRRALADRYDALLAPLAPAIQPIPRVAGCDSAWHLYVVRIDFAALGIGRGALMRALAGEGVGTQVHYIPVHLQPYFTARYGRRTLPGAEKYYVSALSLPMFPAMSDDDADRVVAGLKRHCGLE